jgi:hypothetical protein
LTAHPLMGAMYAEGKLETVGLAAAEPRRQ